MDLGKYQQMILNLRLLFLILSCILNPVTSMLPSMPTTQPTGGEGTPYPPQPSIMFVPSYQLPSGYLNLGYQPQPGQQPFSISGTFANCHPNQGNTQTTGPVTGMESTKFHKEGKALGAIQIIIGFLHIGLGSILVSISTGAYLYGLAFRTITLVYPFLGGLFYITTGIVSVSAIYQPSICMLHGSIGMNIGSIVLVSTGVILLIINEIFYGTYHQNVWAMISGRGMSALLIIFSVLKFAISCVTIHFARLALPVCPANTSQPVWFAPTTSTANLLTQAPPTAPPSSDNPPPYTIHS